MVYEGHNTMAKGNAVQFIQGGEGHSGIAGRYKNTELLGPLLHYFDLIILTPSHFTRLTADTIF